MVVKCSLPMAIWLVSLIYVFISLCYVFSDHQGVRTNAKKDGSDWILNGSKVFITNGYMAGFFNLCVNLFVLCFPVTFRV